MMPYIGGTPATLQYHILAADSRCNRSFCPHRTESATDVSIDFLVLRGVLLREITENQTRFLYTDTSVTLDHDGGPTDGICKNYTKNIRTCYNN